MFDSSPRFRMTTKAAISLKKVHFFDFLFFMQLTGCIKSLSQKNHFSKMRYCFLYIYQDVKLIILSKLLTFNA
jgi:hypothetical protein